MMGELSIPLPAGYRVRDVLAFHSRDAEGVAEQITGNGLRKGILLGGVPGIEWQVELTDHQGYIRRGDAPGGAARRR